MPDTFLPETDRGLLNWATMVSARLAEAGDAYGISPPRSEAFAALVAEYAAALLACDPATRSLAATGRKNAVRRALKQDGRSIMRTVNGNPAVTDDERFAIGLSVRGTGKRAAPPDVAPRLHLQEVRGDTVTVQVFGPAGRSKPAGCVGLTLFAYVDNSTGPTWADWQFVGNFGRTTIDVVFSDLAPGTKVWVTGEWMNSRFEPGPRAAGLFTHLQGGVGQIGRARRAAVTGRARTRAA